ncbi:MAG: hypothetical protein PHI97_14900 [Desulfobulbus sp.]|nr:hypothetical protein [Desulfobulbus sp.]
MANTKRGNFKTMFSAPEAQEKGTTTEGKRPDRVGKKQTIFHMPEAAKKQLAILAIESETTQQALISEALNDLFKKHGKPPIA